MPAQRIAITPSLRLAAAACAVHAAAAAAVWLAPVPLWLKAALTLAMAASLLFVLRREALLRGADAVVALEIGEDGGVSIRTRRGDSRPCELLATSYVSPRLTILNLRPLGERRARHVVLVPDNVDAHDFRRLRTWLRWSARPGLRQSV